MFLKKHESADKYNKSKLKCENINEYRATKPRFSCYDHLNLLGLANEEDLNF